MSDILTPQLFTTGAQFPAQTYQGDKKLFRAIRSLKKLEHLQLKGILATVKELNLRSFKTLQSLCVIVSIDISISLMLILFFFRTRGTF